MANQILQRRRQRMRTKLKLVSKGRPRLSVHRTNKHICVQIIDDVASKTLAAASTLEKDVREKCANGGNIEAAALIGKLIGEKASKAGIKEVVFDRSGFLYHGRVKALAEAARSAGLL